MVALVFSWCFCGARYLRALDVTVVAARRGAALPQGCASLCECGAAPCLHNGRPRAPGQPFPRVNQASRAPFRTALGFGLTTCKLVKACCARHPSSRGVAARPGSIEGEKPTIMGLPIGAALWAAF